MARPCPHPGCGRDIERIDGVVNPRGGRTYWADCGHQVEAALAMMAYQSGDPDVYLQDVNGISLAKAERERQRTEEGYDTAGDIHYQRNELAWAAWCYIDAGATGYWDADKPPEAWPWGVGDWKPGPTAIRCEVKAMALLAADVDRRLALGEQP